MLIWVLHITPIRVLSFTAVGFRVPWRRSLMNLTTEPWIPIVWANGQPGTVSLCEGFAPGGEIRDLAVRPHERIAVMRLLICVAQAALDGPTDHDDWEA